MHSKNIKNKILVTGANGQLGRCMQDIAKEYPHYDFHFKSSSELDITKREAINILFAQEKFEYCINCAAYTAVDKAESDKEMAYLAQACKTNSTILVHISTDFVFDGSKTTPYKEEDVPNPINVYGASKLKGEQWVQSILEQYFIIRTSWVYSEYGHNFVKTMLRLGTERNELGVVNDQWGSPTYAGDLAEAIMKIINLNATNYGLYHFSNEGSITWYDFAKAIFKNRAMNLNVNPISSEAYPTPAIRPRFSVLDKNKSTKLLGLIPNNWTNSLYENLKKTK